MKTRFLKYVDRVIGALLTRLLPAPPASAMIMPGRILILRPGGIGDAALLALALRALRAHFPNISIHILAERRNVGAFFLCPGISSIRCYDDVADFFATLCRRYDVVIDTEQWHRLSAVVARIARADIKIGFATNDRRRLFTHPMPYDHDSYESASFMRLLAPFGVDAGIEKKAPFLSVPARDAENADQFLAPLKGKPFVVVFPGASIPERRWGSEKFRLLSERLHALGLSVVVVGSKENVADGEQIIAGKYGLNLAGKTSLTETAAVIDKSALLVSGDSGILHIGVGLGKPTVSLFGPGRAKKWAPQGDRHIVINKHLPCSPCTSFGYTPKCPINAKCLSDVSVDEVLDAIDKLVIYNRTIGQN